MPHHPVFARFKSAMGEIPIRHSTDFIGTKIRHQFTEEGLYPSVDEEYIEWIDLLESVMYAKSSYTMIELGAGFGRWAVRAAYAVRHYHKEMPYKLIAVEPEPMVFGWMREHFRDNGIDAARHSLIHAVLTDVPGDSLFYVGGPRGGPYDRHPSTWYGQCLTKDYDVAAGSVPDGEYCGFPVLLHKSGWRSIKLPGISLGTILKDLPLVDLIDMDCEGEELATSRNNIEALNAKVKRLHIGTHGAEIESELRQLFFTHRWHCCADHPSSSGSETPWGHIRFRNGVQSWLNPRLT